MTQFTLDDLGYLAGLRPRESFKDGECYAVPQWLPDWRDDAFYKSLEGLSGKQYAWEFLRRNPEYQEDWRRLHAIPQECRYSSPDADSVMDYYFASPPSLPGETRREWVERVKDGTSMPIGMWLKQHYHLAWMVLPCHGIEHVPHIHFTAGVGYVASERKDEKVSIEPGRLGEALVRFNLSMPLGPQLENVKRTMERYAAALERKGLIVRDKPKFDWSVLPQYLRILDARASSPKPTFMEISGTVYPGMEGSEARVKKGYQTALEFSRHRYWQMAIQTRRNLKERAEREGKRRR